MLSGFENPIHILIVLVIVLVLFGAKRLPELGSSLGSGIRGFRDSLSDPTRGAADLPVEPTAQAELREQRPS